MGVILLTSCDIKRVDEDTLVKIYVETSIAAESSGNHPDSLKKYTNSVFSKYDISREIYVKELKKYSDDVEMWDRFFKKSREYLYELKQSGVVN
jgi:uncharacterized protein YycO